MAQPTAQTDLSPQERSVASLFAVDGLRVAEVADRLGLTVETTKSYLKRARSKYRARGVDASTQHRLRVALEADRETTPTS